MKNFSLIRRNGKIELSPAYDLVNTTILLKNAKEELALPLAGKKSGMTRKDLFDYFARDRLSLTEKAIEDVKQTFLQAKPAWDILIDRSFLASDLQQCYRDVLTERWNRMELPHSSP